MKAYLCIQARKIENKTFSCYSQTLAVKNAPEASMAEVYLKSEADKVIAEKDTEIAELKQKLEDVQASAYAESVDAGMRERRLKRALWLARADRAIMTLDYFTLKCRWFKDYMKVEPPKCDVNMVHKWANIERKCRAKAEQYQ